MATVADRNLGDLLVENGVITPLELDEALQRQKLQPDMLGRLLVRMALYSAPLRPVRIRVLPARTPRPPSKSRR